MRDLIDAAERRLADAGVETPRLDAELLLAAAMGTGRPEVVSGLAPDPTPEQIAWFDDCVERRAEREPVAYIKGVIGFRRIMLHVDRRVLIPRPETELLVAVTKVDRPCGILDVATGSGAVALALADELPDATITAVDISDDALDVARANARTLGFDRRVSFARSDLLDSVDGAFDAIAANLPYVRSADIAGLQPEITRYEPVAALDGGEDGLELVRRLAAQAPAHLKPGGMLALEIGDDQAPATEAILRGAGFADVETHQDLAGRDRVMSGRVPA